MGTIKHDLRKKNGTFLVEILKYPARQIHFEILSPPEPQICENMMSLMSPEQYLCYNPEIWGQLINFKKSLQVLVKYENTKNTRYTGSSTTNDKSKGVFMGTKKWSISSLKLRINNKFVLLSFQVRHNHTLAS